MKQKASGKQDSFKEFVMDQLSELHGFSVRPMFGGYGLYKNTTFFGILFKGRLYFKTDEETKPEYRNAGMKPFRAGKQTLKNYLEVPSEILEDSERLNQWAQRAAAVHSEKKSPD